MQQFRSACCRDDLVRLHEPSLVGCEFPARDRWSSHTATMSISLDSERRSALVPAVRSFVFPSGVPRSRWQTLRVCMRILGWMNWAFVSLPSPSACALTCIFWDMFSLGCTCLDLLAASSFPTHTRLPGCSTHTMPLRPTTAPFFPHVKGLSHMTSIFAFFVSLARTTSLPMLALAPLYCMLARSPNPVFRSAPFCLPCSPLGICHPLVLRWVSPAMLSHSPMARQ